MSRLGGGASANADGDPCPSAESNQAPQQGSSGTVEALQQRMLQHLNKVT